EHVRAVGAPRGVRGPGRVRCSVYPLCSRDPGLFSPSGSPVPEGSMKRYTIQRSAVMIIALAVAVSVDAEPPRLELPSLVREVMEKNPDIRAAQQRWMSAKTVIPQVKTLPDPMVNLGYMYDGDMREWTYGVSQELPFPGKLRLRGEVATREAERMEQEYLAVPLRVIARLKEAFYDLAFVHTSIEIVEKNKHILVDFTKTAESRHA